MEAIPDFVARRRPSWRRLEALLDGQRRAALSLAELRELDRLHREAAADLARAQGFYGGTEIHRYLNQLCARSYGTIYQPPREAAAAVRRFFGGDFPRLLREELSYVGVSAAVFLVGILLGVAMAAFEPDAAAGFVPRAVLDHIEARTIWTDDLLTSATPGMVSSAIATNNLSVMITAFALGISAGVGTVLVIFMNGLHLGAIATLCALGGIGPQLLDFVSAHGPVELSLIVIAGGAGLMVGHALIEPGELPRGQRLRERGRRAVQLVLGCAPLMALIGIVEGFVSPGPLFSTATKAALGLGLGVALWGYLLLAGRGQLPLEGQRQG